MSDSGTPAVFGNKRLYWNSSNRRWTCSSSV
jgi:hypothetical protein